MEFKITKFEPIAAIDFNYEEIKQELKEKIDIFKHIVYTEDNIKTAKADRASLNKLKKAMNDKRLEIQREFMKPFDSFKEHMDECIAYVNTCVECVDKQVKEYEAKVREEKRQEIEAKFKELNTFDWLTLDKIFNEKWLNASTVMSSIESEMEFELNAVEANLESLKGLEYEFEATEMFKRNLSLADALNENRRLGEVAAKKAEFVKETPKENLIEVVKVEPECTEPREWMDLKVKINPYEFDALTEWLTEQGIDWRMA